MRSQARFPAIVFKAPPAPAQAHISSSAGSTLPALLPGNILSVSRDRQVRHLPEPQPGHLESKQGLSLTLWVFRQQLLLFPQVHPVLMPWKALPGSRLDEAFPCSLLTARPRAYLIRRWSIYTARLSS